MGTIYVQYSDNVWKSRLRDSQSEKKYLAKCLVRERTRIAKLRLALQTEKTTHQLLRNQHLKREQILGEVPLGHQFPVVLMYLTVFFQVNLGLSYRQCSIVLAHFLELLQCPIACPSYSTIRVWRIADQIHKLGCYVLKNFS